MAGKDWACTCGAGGYEESGKIDACPTCGLFLGEPDVTYIGRPIVTCTRCGERTAVPERHEIYCSQREG